MREIRKLTRSLERWAASEKEKEVCEKVKEKENKKEKDSLTSKNGQTPRQGPTNNFNNHKNETKHQPDDQLDHGILRGQVPSHVQAGIVTM